MKSAPVKGLFFFDLFDRIFRYSCSFLRTSKIKTSWLIFLLFWAATQLSTPPRINKLSPFNWI